MPHTPWSCGVPLALRQTEAGLRGPHGRSQGDGGGGPLVGQGLSILEDEQTSAPSSRVGSAPSRSQSRRQAFLCSVSTAFITSAPNFVFKLSFLT